MSLTKVQLFGLEFISAASVAEVAEYVIADRANSRHNDFVVTPNAHMIVSYAEPRYHYIRDFYSGAAYILPDGMPIVWLGRMKGRKLESRLTGSDLFPELWKRLKQKNIPVTFILPWEEMTAMFRNDYANCNSLVPKFFDAGDTSYIAEFVREACDAIMSNGSQYVFLGLSFPKQELMAMEIDKELRNRGYEKGVLFLLLGASYEFYSGLKKRAPAFYRKTGLEWLYRFMQEPGRMWKRYTVGNMKFVALAIKELLKK